ncbi:UNVERIFIED_CONTAM: hypothetical protein Sangu_3079300 [Sesamum angustifolium]|uniref:Secreted protein n=1 Tax=Sesamum angustifolium TaxID=2727405 RepID=A0AAW2K8P8_9LAMI
MRLAMSSNVVCWCGAVPATSIIVAEDGGERRTVAAVLVCRRRCLVGCGSGTSADAFWRMGVVVSSPRKGRGLGRFRKQF